MAAVPWHYVIIYDVTYVNETALLLIRGMVARAYIGMAKGSPCVVPS